MSRRCKRCCMKLRSEHGSLCDDCFDIIQAKKVRKSLYDDEDMLWDKEVDYDD
jgi:hypothetical protein